MYERHRVKIEEFCHFIKRYSIKFEYDVVCVKKEDINEEKTKDEWKEEFIVYIKRTDIKDY